MTRRQQQTRRKSVRGILSWMKLEFVKKESKKLIQNNQIYGGGKKLPYTRNGRIYFGGKKNNFSKEYNQTKRKLCHNVTRLQNLYRYI